MQETEYNGEHWKEFFSGKNDAAVKEKMDNRLAELKTKGHKLVKRVKIGRNDLCPCGSGKKFKRCHLGQER